MADDNPVLASTTTFGILELVGRILLHTNPAQIILCKRVNRTFKSHIETSVYLRQAIFLAPDGEPIEPNKEEMRSQIEPKTYDEDSWYTADEGYV
jgi:hypothetical protein